MRRRRQGLGQPVAVYANERLQLLAECGLIWNRTPSTKYLLDDFYDMTQGEILSLEPSDLSPQALISRPGQLECSILSEQRKLIPDQLPCSQRSKATSDAQKRATF